MRILTTLSLVAAAAASAQTAPAPAAKQALSYNRVIVSYVSSADITWTNSNVYTVGSGVSVTAQVKLPAGFYITATTVDRQSSTWYWNEQGDAGEPTSAVTLGYAYSLPSVLGVATDLNLEAGANVYGAGLRFLIGGGVELNVAYATHSGSDNNGINYVSTDVFTVGASYNLGFLVKGLSLNASLSSETGDYGIDTTSVGIGYNF